MFPHRSVLLEEVAQIFKETQIKFFFDGTLGAGGHAEVILQEHPEIELYIGADQDPDALSIARQRLASWKDKVALVQGNFETIDQLLKAGQAEKVDGALLDLGVSSMQIDRPERGFSFSKEGPLDMRMDPTSPLTAEEIVNEWTAAELGKIFRSYGEEKRWRAAACAIAQARKKGRIQTTRALAEILNPVLFSKKKGINPLTLIFQGLRIAVNRELEVIEDFLPKALERLAPKGRLAIISFHSLEDRIIKNAMRFAASDKWDTSGIGGLFRDKEPQVKLLTRKPIVPGKREIEENPRSRSAKLRAVEKV